MLLPYWFQSIFQHYTTFQHHKQAAVIMTQTSILTLSLLPEIDGRRCDRRARNPQKSGLPGVELQRSCQHHHFLCLMMHSL